VTLTCPWNGPAVINPSQLPSCSSGTCSNAHCLPAAYVPAADKPQLKACGSGANAGYCVPDTIITTAGDVKPPTCQPFDGQGEGRCMSTCLTSVESQASSLQQTSCSSGTLCAPCWDPFTGAATGACTSSSCDQPATPTPYKFPSCCPGSNPPATCVPSYEVPSSQQGSLAQNGCPSQFLCVPDEYIPNLSASYQPQTCNYLGLFAGACVNSCAVSGISLASSGQGSCGSGHLCVSCTLSSLFGSAPPGC
jgi:hypothetical protein